MTKLTLTSAVTAFIAGSALLAGVAFASDEMFTSGTMSGNAISTLAHSTTAAGEEKGDVISAAAKTQNDATPADVDNTNDENAANDKNEAADNDTDEAADNDVDMENDHSTDKTDADQHGDAVSAIASGASHHSDKGR